MEPMSLGGSPNKSPNQSQYIPSFLLGNADEFVAHRRNALSPRNEFGNSSNLFSPNQSLAEGNSFLGVNSFRNSSFVSNDSNYTAVPSAEDSTNQNVSRALRLGPPKQSLFDKMREDRLKPYAYGASAFGESSNPNFSGVLNTTRFSEKSSFSTLPKPDPYFMEDREMEFWITVFGFPRSFADGVYQYVTELCGPISDKFTPSFENCNYMHLRFDSRVNATRALNFNGHTFNEMIIGIIRCKDPEVKKRSDYEKENLNVSNTFPSKRRMRSLAYDLGRDPMLKPPSLLERSSLMRDLVYKAADLLFNW